MSNTHTKRHQKRLLISGGHLTPAIAVVEVLRADQDWQVWALLPRSSPAVASGTPHYEELRQLGVELIFVPAGKLSRHWSRRSVKNILTIPLGIASSFFKVRAVQPHLILSFGGYLALPAAVSGKLLGIPIITHEQTVTKGLANAVIERFANVVAVSWPESAKHFHRDVVVTGNPLRQAIIAGKGMPVPIAPQGRPLLFITGGNQGARAINAVIERLLPVLLSRYAIVHQCGLALSQTGYHRLVIRRNEFPTRIKGRYLVRPWFRVEEIAWLLHHANLVISRAGANTVSEIAYSGAVALLVPLPIAGNAEQYQNALFLKNLGSGEILAQERLTPGTLLATIQSMLKRSTSLRAAAEKAKSIVPADAAHKLVELIEATYEKAKKTSSNG